LSSEEINHEQEHVSVLYRRLDEMHRRTSQFLASALRESDGTPGGLTERDIATARHGERLAAYSAAEYGLCFGRLDFHLDGDGSNGEPAAQQDPVYVGRIGIFDDEYEPMLLDWRAPSARPFYLATAAAPQGVARRRHIRTSKRQVTGIDDEVLDISSASQDKHVALTGEAALLSALNAHRTGRMGDIVETIQAEQDRIIRADHHGVLVVQGGPGTGKTAVALHRAAYLMYTHRDRLANRGVLVVGPNPTFLKYIEQVLPSLGETAVSLVTMGTLFPGVRATVTDSPTAAVAKGRIEMVEVIQAAIRNRQLVPDEPHPIRFEGEEIALDRATAVNARRRARSSRRPHNLARAVFTRHVIAALAQQYGNLVGANVLDGPSLMDSDDLEDVRREMYTDADIDRVIDEYWPVLSPQEFLSDFYADADRIGAAAKDLTEAERHSLLRARDTGWSAGDVPLLDEAAELLGIDERAAKAQADRERREEIDYAQGVLDIIEGSRSADFEDDAEEEMLSAADLIDADQLADRQDHQLYLSTAERAAADREWTFGHVIVDEAQELSAMAWRAVMRRSPTRSMTLVGDVAQTGDPAGSTSWSAVLEPYLGDRWQLEHLTVNYRTPSEVTDIADRVLASINPEAVAPQSVRSSGQQPWQRSASARTLEEVVREETALEQAVLDGGRMAVLAPESRVPGLRVLLDSLSPTPQPASSARQAGGGSELEQEIVVLGVNEAKGLEFDSVLIVDPQGIVAESMRGLNNLYVALTRPTQRLGVVHLGDLPQELAGLQVRS